MIGSFWPLLRGSVGNACRSRRASRDVRRRPALRSPRLLPEVQRAGAVSRPVDAGAPRGHAAQLRLGVVAVGVLEDVAGGRVDILVQGDPVFVHVLGDDILAGVKVVVGQAVRLDDPDPGGLHVDVERPVAGLPEQAEEVQLGAGADGVGSLVAPGDQLEVVLPLAPHYADHVVDGPRLAARARLV